MSEKPVDDEKRSPRWPGVRKAHLKKEPYCAACPKPGIFKRAMIFTGIHAMQVHHILPFHFVVALGRPDLELDDRNLITLCASGTNHHLLLGHLDDFHSYNPSVRKFVEAYAKRNRQQIISSTDWQQSSMRRPPKIDAMTQVQKDQFKHLMSELYPT